MNLLKNIPFFSLAKTISSVEYWLKKNFGGNKKRLDLKQIFSMSRMKRRIAEDLKRAILHKFRDRSLSFVIVYSKYLGKLNSNISFQSLTED